MAKTKQTKNPKEEYSEVTIRTSDRKKELFGYFGSPAIEVLDFLGRGLTIMRYKSITCPLGGFYFQRDVEASLSPRQLMYPTIGGLEIDQVSYEQQRLPKGVSLRAIGTEEDKKALDYLRYNFGSENDSPKKWLKQFGGVLALNLECRVEDRVKLGFQNYLDAEGKMEKFLFEDQFPSYDTGEIRQRLNDLLEIAKLCGVIDPTRKSLRDILKSYRDKNKTEYFLEEHNRH